MSHSKCFDRNPDDLGYLSVRREWYRRCSSDVQPSYHKGTPLYHPASANTSDIRLCELFDMQKFNVPYDEVETGSYNAMSYSTCPDPSCPPKLEPGSVGRLQKSLVAVTNVFKTFSNSCSYGSGVEQSQTSQSPSSTSIDIDQEKMTDSEQRNQPGRSPKDKKSAVSKFFKRLSLSKKREDELGHPSTPSPEEQGASTEGSTTMTHVNISYAPVAQPDLSSESYYAAPRVSSATSRDVPPDQSLQAKQHRLLRRLHSTLNEATVIVEEFLLLYKPDN